MRQRRLSAHAGSRAHERRAIFWSAAALAGFAVLGLLVVPGGRVIWIVLLVFAVMAIPQGIALTREQRPAAGGRAERGGSAVEQREPDREREGRD